MGLAQRDIERAKVMGSDLPAEPERPSIYGKALLQDGQFLCQGPKCPKYRSHGELAVGLAVG